MKKLIPLDKSIVVSADVDSLAQLTHLVRQTCDHPRVGGFKVGFSLVLPFGLNKTVEVIRGLTSKPVIYDMQKAATDIPEMGVPFAKACKNSGVDSVILFPMTGPKTEQAWVAACLEEGLHTIVGGEMTHPGYLDQDDGWIRRDQMDRLYTLAREGGIRDFVVPGNKPDRITHYRRLLGEEAIFYSPGLVTQGGELSASAVAAGKTWHAIVGRAIVHAEDRYAMVEELAQNLT